MRKRRKFLVMFCGLMLIGLLWFPLTLTSYAEELEVPGYCEYIERDGESIVHWYGISRGTYLKDGTCGIVDAGKGKVSISGTTTAHAVCDKVKVGICLDESSDGGKSFGQIGSYYFSEDNTATCYGSKTNISATSGYWYICRGGHSVTKGTKTETTTTQSRALRCS